MDEERNGLFLELFEPQPQEQLPENIRLANSLSELWGGKEPEKVLIDADDPDYEAWSERVYGEYREDISQRDSFEAGVPSEDIRMYFLRTTKDRFLTDHKEYSQKELEQYLQRKGCQFDQDGITAFEPSDIDDCYQVVSEINQNCQSKLLLVHFLLSSYVGILSPDDIEEGDLVQMVRWGMIHNRADLPERILKLLL